MEYFFISFIVICFFNGVNILHQGFWERDVSCASVPWWHSVVWLGCGNAKVVIDWNLFSLSFPCLGPCSVLLLKWNKRIWLFLPLFHGKFYLKNEWMPMLHQNPLSHLLQIGAQLAMVCPSGDNWRAGCANPILTLISGLHLDEVTELRILLRLLCNKGSTIRYRWFFRSRIVCFSLEFPWFPFIPTYRMKTSSWSVSHPNIPSGKMFLAFWLRLSFKERLGSPCFWCRASLQ